jgi:PLP dependent protein
MVNSSLVCMNLQKIHGRIAIAAESVDRNPADITLVAVTKTAEREAIEEAYECGARDFGENRVQDALRKFDNTFPLDARLHLIGSLQSNKAGKTVERFDLVHSVDRQSIVASLADQAHKRNKIQDILLEVNVSGEAQKAGCPLKDVDELMKVILNQPSLRMLGLMTMAPLAADPNSIRWVFRDLRELRSRINEKFAAATLDILSMGMTNDFEVAIQEGATHVRIGRAIFGG